VRGKCYNCADDELVCRHDGVFAVSLSYWIPRQLRLHTFPDKYMPYSTPRMDEYVPTCEQCRADSRRTRRNSDSMFTATTCATTTTPV